MPRGWTSEVRREADRTVVSDQTIALDRPAVTETEAGARLLAEAYWAAIRGETLGLVRVFERRGLVEQRLLGLVPLLRLCPELAPARARFAIVGGLSARRPGGSLLLAQERDGDGVRLHARIEGYVPRLPLYALQAWLHVRTSRRWAARLARA